MASEKKQLRAGRTIRATDDEWDILKRIAANNGRSLTAQIHWMAKIEDDLQSSD